MNFLMTQLKGIDSRALRVVSCFAVHTSTLPRELKYGKIAGITSAIKSVVSTRNSKIEKTLTFSNVTVPEDPSRPSFGFALTLSGERTAQTAILGEQV